MKASLLFLFSSLITFSNVQTQIVEINGDLSNSVQASLKYSTIKDAKMLVELRNSYFELWSEYIGLLTSQPLTYTVNGNMTAITEEITRQRKLCVKYMNVEYYLNWYNDLRAMIEKDFVPKVTEVIDKFLKTMTGKKVVRCWLAGKDFAKQCLQYDIVQPSYRNITESIVANYTSYKKLVKGLLDDAKKNITKFDSANYFITNNKDTMWSILNGFIGSVMFFSNNQTEATSQTLSKTFSDMIPKCEALLANITECVNTKVTKIPKTTKAG